jgi:hypothetical protein
MKYRKKKIQAIYDSVDIENRLPIFTQNVQTNISFQINIWMVHLHVSIESDSLAKRERNFSRE